MPDSGRAFGERVVIGVTAPSVAGACCWMRVLTAWTRVRAVAAGARGERRAEGGQDVLAVDDESGQRDDGVDAAQGEASGGGADRELDHEQGQQRPGGEAVETQ